jgi:hypothetical protein
MEPVCSIDGGKVMGSCPSFQCGLFGVLGAFDVLFEGVFKTVPIGEANVCMLFTKVVVRPDDNIFVVQIPLDLVIWLVGKGIGVICGPRLVLEYDIVLLPLREVSCDARSDFVGVTVVPEVCVVSINYDGDRGSF